jgi:uncharacterized damage-inducible protein DinB
MKDAERIKWLLASGRDWLLKLIEDFSDKEMLAQPTAGRGNHALWVLGHLAWTDGGILYGYVKKGQANPLNDWSGLFGMGSQPVADAGKYPAKAEILARWDKIRQEVNDTLGGLSDEDLARPTGADLEMFKTVGNSLAALAIHQAFHTGQVSAVRRTLGKAAVFG